MKAPTIVAIGLAACLLAIVLWALAESGPRLQGSNGVLPQIFAVSLDPGQRACAARQTVPAGARGVAVVLATYGRPSATIGLDATAGGKKLFTGQGSFRQGEAAVEISPAPRAVTAATLCVTNLSSGTIGLGGLSGLGSILIDGKRSDSAITVLYPVSNKRSWLDQATVVAERFSHVRWAPFGAATLWFALLLALVAGGAAVVVTIRGAPDG